MADPISLNRNQIAAFVGNDPDAIRAIERLFKVAGQLTPEQIATLTQLIFDNTLALGAADNKAEVANSEALAVARMVSDVAYAAGVADNKADAAMSIAVAAERMASLAATQPIAQEDPRLGILGSMAFQNSNSVSITGGTIDGSMSVGGTWTAAATWTLPAFTLGGTVTSNNQSFSGTIANLGTVTTVDINGGTIDGTTIGGASPAVGTFTAVNATTVDTTNLEVTTLKAKDGTAAGSIADATGVVTLNSSVLTTTDINGGTIDGTTIGGTSAAAGTFTTATATTGNITTVNATTVDTTNIEVTTLKAKDGTSAGSIADSTGVVTLASSVLTTTDINGGTIDGTTIGGSSAAAGTFTTVTASGDVTIADKIVHDGDTNTSIRFPAADTVSVETNGSERNRTTSSGDFLVAKTGVALGTVGIEARAIGLLGATRSGGEPLLVNRLVSDGVLVTFQQDSVTEGNISVSGTTVSYNGGHLSRWAQFPDNSRPELLKGTVMSNLEQMSNWDNEDNEQLNCVQVSTVEGDANVAGVFVAWDTTEDEYNDILLGMTGDMVIRIAGGTTVQRGDLLMSAGDGTAKPQGDDIVRSKTIAKVTSTHVSHTYEDGSYAVPCVLMAC